MKTTIKIPFLKFGLDIGIELIRNNDPIEKTIEFILKEKKLGAVKTLKDNFDLSLKEAKIIVDEIIEYDSNKYSWVLLIKTKKEMRKKIKKDLEYLNKYGYIE